MSFTIINDTINQKKKFIFNERKTYRCAQGNVETKFTDATNQNAVYILDILSLADDLFDLKSKGLQIKNKSYLKFSIGSNADYTPTQFYFRNKPKPIEMI